MKVQIIMWHLKDHGQIAVTFWSLLYAYSNTVLEVSTLLSYIFTITSDTVGAILAMFNVPSILYSGNL